MNRQENVSGSLRYLITYPEGYTEGKKYPVLFFLHGAGSRGEDMTPLRNNPFYQVLNTVTWEPFITVAPQCRWDTWFDDFGAVVAFARGIAAAPFTDPERFYGMGVSMGGYGIWQLGMTAPELFAGLVPICGGGMYWNAARLRTVPVWAFHGDADPVVAPAESVKMTEGVTRAGGSARLTLYPGAGHNAWDATFTDPAVFRWLFSLRRQGNGSGKTDLAGADRYG